jgi:DNA-binding transcriptional regulator GbsR (MarR family)
MGMKAISMRINVIELLFNSHVPLTATEIACILDVKLASLSSVLRKMYDAGVLTRVDGYGLRGGYGYQVNHS